MKEPKYVITGINKLTDKREVISLPYLQDKAERLLEKTKKILKRRRDSRCYIGLRLEEYQSKDQRPRFTPPHKNGPGSV